MMNQKIMIKIIGLILILGFFGELLAYFEIHGYAKLTVIFGGIGRIAGLILILRRGILIKTKGLYQLILLFIGITLLGTHMKISHYPYGNLILLIGLLGIFIIYNLHFLKKQSRDLLDYIKFVWLTLFTIAVVFTIQHYPFNDGLRGIEGMLFLIMFIYFASSQSNPLPEGG